MNYYPFHIGDYLSATRHLSWEEDAAYRRLLDTYYTTEKPLPPEHRAVCRLVLAQTESQREAVKTILDEFFELTDCGWINRRADSEICSMKEKQQKQRDKANKRWQKHGQEPGNAQVMPQHKESDATALKNDADVMPPTPTPTPEEKTPLPPLPDTMEYPEWLNLELWRKWKEWKREMGQSVSLFEEEVGVQQLKDFKDQGMDVSAVIRQSITNRYKGFFPVRGQTVEKKIEDGGRSQAMSEAEKTKQYLNEIYAD